MNIELRYLFTRMLRGEPVYVGCMGGWGRTGMMLALIAKAAGQDQPVEFVRKHYTPRAVETDEQYAWVRNFDVRPIQRWLRWAAVRNLHRRFF